VAHVPCEVPAVLPPFVYVAGKWYYRPADMDVYSGHNVAQAVATARADGVC
jgi:hypothetical protein